MTPLKQIVLEGVSQVTGIHVCFTHSYMITVNLGGTIMMAEEYMEAQQ